MVRSILANLARPARLRLMTALVACAICAACATLAGCAWLLEDPAASGRRPGAGASAGRRPPRSLHAYPWVWTDEQGREVRFSRWRGEPLVVTLAFTSCRETCPRTIRKLRDLDARFRRERRPASFVVVTLDPRHDTPERLREFKRSERLPAAWHLLVGTPSATQALSDLVGMHVVDLDSHQMHDGSVVLFDEEGRAARSFTGWNLDRETVLF